MAQITTWPIPSGPSGLAMRQQVNLITEALRTSNSGATAPTPTVAGMLWFDTSATPGVLKQRNSANDAWATLGAPAIPSASAGTGVGQFQNTDSGLGQELLLPAGGTWAYALQVYNSSGQFVEVFASVAAGGSSIYGPAAGFRGAGFLWRIA